MLQPKLESYTLPLLKTILSEITFHIQAETSSPESLFKVSNQTVASHTGLSVHYVVFGQCVCSFQERCVCACVCCSVVPYGSSTSPQCKHSWLPPVAAWVNSSLPTDTKSPNGRITFTARTLIWLLAMLGIIVCCL